MAANKLIFKDAEKARDAITASQKKEIGKLYKNWAAEIGEKAEYYSHKSAPSYAVAERQMKELMKQMEATSHKVTNEIYMGVKKNMYLVADSVVQQNVEWLKSLGFAGDTVDAVFNYVPDEIVRNIVTGQIYDSGWSLSKRIWSDNEDTMKTAHQIVAGGMAQNKSIYEIAKDLESYVEPGAKKPWNLRTKDGRKIYPKQVDYNAQRLARTLVQHGYQQSFKATTEKNPFIEAYKWNANGSRVCDLCTERETTNIHGLGPGIYPKDQMPMDHPNGMCTMEPVVVDNLVDQLADWFNSEDGTYPEIDDFAKNFGYTPVTNAFSPLQDEYLSPYGFSVDNMPKSFDDWSHKVSYEQANEILESMGTSWEDDHPYQQLMKYYNQNLAKLNTQVAKSKIVPGISDGAQFATKYGTSKGKTFNYWYTKLDSEAKGVAKQLKEASGLTWQQWYEQNIYAGANKVTKAVASKSAKAVGSKMPANTNALFDMIKGQTESDMLSMETRAFAKLTKTQSNALKKYTGNSYDSMNGYLRYLAAGKSEAEAMDLSGITRGQLNALAQARKGLAKTALEKDVTLRRGTDLGDLAGFLDGDFFDNKRALARKSVEELNNKFAGTTGTYAGFTSTSSIYDRGFEGNVEVILYAPKGTQGSSIMSISQYGTGEGETLLNAGTEVIIHKVEESDGHKGSTIRVFMEIIGTKK